MLTVGTALAAFAPAEAGSIGVEAKITPGTFRVPLRRRAAAPSRLRSTLAETRIGIAKAWQLLLAQRRDEADALIDQIEVQIGHLPTLAARRLTDATYLLRAASLAFEDQWLAANTMAQLRLERHGTFRGAEGSLTLYKMGLWKLVREQAFRSMPRRLPRNGCPHSEAIATGFDLSIEAAFAIDHLHLTTAKRLATHASRMFQPSDASEGNAGDGLILLPLALIALVHYEQGDLDEAERLISDRLPVVDAEGSIETALRCYLVLARIARYRTHFDLAAILLRGGEALGEKRGWPRLVVACVAERVSLLLEIGRREEARMSLDHCDRYLEASAHAQGQRDGEIAQFRALAEDGSGVLDLFLELNANRRQAFSMRGDAGAEAAALG